MRARHQIALSPSLLSLTSLRPCHLLSPSPLGHLSVSTPAAPTHTLPCWSPPVHPRAAERPGVRFQKRLVPDPPGKTNVGLFSESREPRPGRKATLSSRPAGARASPPPPLMPFSPLSKGPSPMTKKKKRRRSIPCFPPDPLPLPVSEYSRR